MAQKSRNVVSAIGYQVNNQISKSLGCTGQKTAKIRRKVAVCAV
jgi:hypothetical protein